MKMFVEPERIYLHRDAVDFRKSIDGLVAIVEGELEGKLYHEIGRFEKSIGICHKCEQHHVLTLSDRNFICIACAKQQNRDLSAKKVSLE